jgi:hypothetical protein
MFMVEVLGFVLRYGHYSVISSWLLNELNEPKQPNLNTMR